MCIARPLAVVLLSICVSKTTAATLSQWASLNASVHGRLHTAVPFARPCFALSETAYGSFDTVRCAKVQNEYLDADIRTSTFGAYMATQWEGCQATSEQCALDWMNPGNMTAFTPPATCSQGSVAPYYINVRSASDVQEAFTFSRKTGVPVIVKNTGHDYNGRSSRKDSLALWTHSLKSITYTEKFIPRGCPSASGTPGVTLGAGVQHEELFAFADAHNITLPGGACATVGVAGGYLMGGGHSWLSNIYGLAVDRVLEFEIVTPSGEHIFANACQHQDLYFALRGGGGGTFGVVLSSTTKGLKQDAYTSVQFTYTSDSTTLPKFMSFLVQNGVHWAEDGWSGQIRPTSKLVLTKLGVDLPGVEAYMAPLKALALDINGTVNIRTSSSYKAFHDAYVAPDAKTELNGIPQTVVSRLIPATTLRDNSDELLQAIVGLTSAAPVVLIFANAPYSFKQDATLGNTSLHPAWRKAVWHVVAGTAWLYDTPVEVQENLYAGLTAGADALRAISPSSGAYQNEADLHEPNFRESFWGPNYQQLVAIKRKYDPHHMLDCWHCIDSDAEGKAFSCYL